MISLPHHRNSTVGARPLVLERAKLAFRSQEVIVGVDGMMPKKGDVPVVPPSRFTIYHVADTVLYGVQMTLGYLLMLVAMTFNVGLFVAVIVGLSLGHFALAPPTGSTNTVDTTDCCG